MVLIFVAGSAGAAARPLRGRDDRRGERRGRLSGGITLPMMGKVIAIAVLVRGIDLFRIFDYVFVMTSGGPGTSTYTLSLYAWQQTFSFVKWGYGATLSLFTLADHPRHCQPLPPYRQGEVVDMNELRSPRMLRMLAAWAWCDLRLSALLLDVGGVQAGPRDLQRGRRNCSASARPSTISRRCSGFRSASPAAGRDCRAAAISTWLPRLWDSIVIATRLDRALRRHRHACRLCAVAHELSRAAHFVNWVLSTRMMPPVAVAVPMFFIYKNFGLSTPIPASCCPRADEHAARRAADEELLRRHSRRDRRERA